MCVFLGKQTDPFECKYNSCIVVFVLSLLINQIQLYNINVYCNRFI